MKFYSIEAGNEDELKKIMSVVNKFKHEEVVDLKTEPGIMVYRRVSFTAEKCIWKQIKKDLNLRVRSVFAEFKED